MLIDERALRFLRDRNARASGLRDLARFVGASARSVPGHEAWCEDYDAVVATSDLHADFAKTVQLMSAAGLIKLPRSLDAYDDVYNVRLITETEWVATKTLFVICGDLVDGRRPGRGDVDDEEGSFELRLHCFLYNMRVRAARLGSAVKFTIGNHDMHTVIRNDGQLDPYVSPRSVAFFGTMRERSNSLRPFYACSPYLIFTLCTLHGSEVVFVHGGLRQDARSLYDDTAKVQREVDALGPDERLGALSDHFALGMENDSGHVTWRREYARNDRCMHNEDMRRRGCELIVVGHCHTMTGDLADLARAQCSGTGGCMLLACEDSKSPLIAFVDTAMSSCFHASADEARERSTQMLLLTKGGGAPRTSTYGEARRTPTSGAPRTPTSGAPRTPTYGGAPRTPTSGAPRTSTYSVGRLVVGPDNGRTSRS